VGDYWDDVDACVRNTLVEQQFTQMDQATAFIEMYDADPEGMLDGLPGQYCTDNVLERLHGVYFSGSFPTGAGLTSIGCCTGNGPMGFYYAWEAAVREADHITHINLMLNRGADSVDVASWLPYSGRVEIAVKTAPRVAVRIPRWVAHREMRAQLQRGSEMHEVTPIWTGNFITVTDLKPGDQIVFTFPVTEESVTYTWNKRVPDQERDFTFEMRGSTCVSASPREWMGPGWVKFYQREHMKSDTAPMRDVKRYRPERVFRNW